ncbi:Serine carboxypeptidase-like 27 [Carex littledalei]|uniref:Serine carboxypeptidase-like 27 n=1 Tax=Carex littledalei TaxID=544730 RepID=A0A833V609_9POAL|nr:Serine carboxypeptidase-like 27 [Carex littledalei]
MPCDVEDLLGTMLAISMGVIQVTILMNGGGTTLDGEDELQMVPWLNMEDAGGDTNSVVPLTGTRYSIDALNLSSVTSWYAWYDVQAGGGGIREGEGDKREREEGSEREKKAVGQVQRRLVSSWRGGEEERR